LRERHLAIRTRPKAEIRQFVYSSKAACGRENNEDSTVFGLEQEQKHSFMNESPLLLDWTFRIVPYANVQACG